MHNGRNFEYISGEDPVLGSTMVVPVVQGIQKNVMAISKHYILNNQETHRSGVNELVDEATLMELYGPPFAAAVQESAGVMCACFAFVVALLCCAVLCFSLLWRPRLWVWSFTRTMS